jgi:hypothetical protein
MRKLLTAPKKPQSPFISAGVRDLDKTGSKSYLNICFLVDNVKHQSYWVFFVSEWSGGAGNIDLLQ